jgi:hypothetical protein
MFELPDSWDETRTLLSALLMFFDRAPMLVVEGVGMVDFQHLCREMPNALERFMRTGLASAWPVPVEIHGTHADWLLLPCGVLSHRPRDFVLRWNVRAIQHAPQWALNLPGVAAFFPHIVLMKHDTGHVDTYIWQQIWQRATAKFFHGNAWQQLVELKALCEQDMANTSWRYREDVLVAKLHPEQQQMWNQVAEPPEMDVQPVPSTRVVDGFMELPIMACCKGHGERAAFFCTVCTQLYCDKCSLLSEHSGHVFKFLK